MHCRLGNYEFPEGRVEITRRDTPEFNDARQVISNTIRLDCSSALYASSASEMDGLVTLLLQAFQQGGNDFLVFLPGGSVRTQLCLLNSGAIGGVRVVQPPTIESLKNGGYVTWLPFSFALEAEYPAAAAGALYREWSESITFDPLTREAWLLCLHGSHQKQQVRERPFYRAVQSGRAVGYLGYPSPPRPIWFNAWMNRDTQPDLESPRRRGSDYVDYPISWRYEFQSDRPLSGVPNPWPS